MLKADKGLVSEALAQAYFAKDPNLIVFTALGGVGPIDQFEKVKPSFHFDCIETSEQSINYNL